jgi:hypothetical protein
MTQQAPPSRGLVATLLVVVILVVATPPAPAGTLYGFSDVFNQIYAIDTATGAATIVGMLEDEFALPVDPSAMAFDEDGDLFVLKSNTAPPEIYEVDPPDATVLVRVPLPGLPLSFDGGMEFDDSTGILYLSCGGMLYRANPSTGGTILVGPTPGSSALEIVADCGLPSPVVMPVPPRLGSGSGPVGTGTPGASASGAAELRR